MLKRFLILSVLPAVLVVSCSSNQDQAKESSTSSKNSVVILPSQDKPAQPATAAESPTAHPGHSKTAAIAAEKKPGAPDPVSATRTTSANSGSSVAAPAATASTSVNPVGMGGAPAAAAPVGGTPIPTSTPLTGRRTPDSINAEIVRKEQARLTQFQQTQAADRQAQGVINQIDTAANLTPVQKQRLKSIVTNTSAQVQALRSDRSLSEQQRSAKAKVLQQTSIAQVQKVLTPTQQKKLQDSYKQQAVTQMAEEPLQRIDRAVNLSPEQKVKVRALLHTSAEQTLALMQDTGSPNNIRSAKFASLQAAVTKQMKQILTPEQQKKLEDAQQQAMYNNQVNSPLQALDQVATLTPDQKIRIKGLLEKASSQSQVIQKNAALPVKDRGQQLRQLYETTQAQIKLLLTPEQQKKLDDASRQAQQQNPGGPGLPQPGGGPAPSQPGR